jgi:folate-binding protein YgfZ
MKDGHEYLSVELDFWDDSVGAFEPEKVIRQLGRAFPNLEFDATDYQQVRLLRELEIWEELSQRDGKVRESLIANSWHLFRTNGPTFRFEIPFESGHRVKGGARRMSVGFHVPIDLPSEHRERLLAFLDSLDLGKPRQGRTFQEKLMDDLADLSDGVLVFDHGEAGWIELAEADARSFLNNLATNDVKNLKDGDGCELFLTTAKARVVGHGVVTAHGDRLRLEAEPGRAAAMLKHLDHYLISERVELVDRTAELGRLTLLGPRAAEVIEKTTGLAVSDLRTWSHRGAEVTVRRQGFVSPIGFDVIAAKPKIAELRKQFADVPAGSPATWETLRIEAGWPHWGHELDENRFVVETGRIAQAICYTKGCYLGQEPIVMARDRGQVNRRLVGLVADVALPAGSRILQGEIEAVRVTSSAFSPRLGKTVCLAYAYRGHQEPGTALAFAEGTATIVPLPMD